MKDNKKIWKNLIMEIIVFIINFITVMAGIGVILSLCGMIESWKITTDALIVLICSGAWLGAYAYLIN